MDSLNFMLENGDVYVSKGQGKKKISKDAMLEICYLLLGHIAEPRDYTSVTSVKKLLHIIDVECQPDESDAEDEKEAPVKPSTKTVPVPAAKKAVAAPKKAPPTEASSSEDSDE